MTFSLSAASITFNSPFLSCSSKLGIWFFFVGFLLHCPGNSVTLRRMHKVARIRHHTWSRCSMITCSIHANDKQPWKVSQKEFIESTRVRYYWFLVKNVGSEESNEDSLFTEILFVPEVLSRNGNVGKGRRNLRRFTAKTYAFVLTNRISHFTWSLVYVLVNPGA